jgi:UDP-glucuronate decarboxylase
MISRDEQARLQTDADRVIKAQPEVFSALDGADIFLTGGTGFVGSWLLEVLTRAVDTLGVNARVTVLTRSSASFATNTPHLFYHRAVTIQSGDIETTLMGLHPYTHVIHAALPAGNPSLGTARLLEQSRKAGVKHFVFVSSGAVYGGRASIDPIYKQGKLEAENLCGAAAVTGTFDVTIARCYTFLGPYFPLPGHYAISCFLRNVMSGQPITVTGDGSVMRTYMYGADLALQLLALLNKRIDRVVEVGSDVLVSMRELAMIVSQALGQPNPVNVEEHLTTVSREVYAPKSWANRLKIPQNFWLAESIRRMAQFYGWEGR